LLAVTIPLVDATVIDADLSGETLPASRLKRCLLERVSFSSAVLRSAEWMDVRFVKCDFSNADLRGLRARRVEFFACRLTGANLCESHWEDVLVEGCESRYAQWADGSLLHCEFVDSRLEETDFRNVNLEANVFRSSNLTKADLTAAQLRGVDLRSTVIDGILVRPEDVRGAHVSAPQAMDLARLLGLIIGG
jgi:uncharacterized protein YjbI with pentapeptide repeats